MVDAVALRGPAVDALPPHLRPAYAELRAAQVKTVSFVTFLLRIIGEALRPYAPRLSLAVVHLLLTCPDVVATRKELLVATRHMLGTEFRVAFRAHTDTLLSEQALLGGGRAAHDALRPLAISLLVSVVLARLRSSAVFTAPATPTHRPSWSRAQKARHDWRRPLLPAARLPQLRHLHWSNCPE
jgi:hypothetical protein